MIIRAKYALLAPGVVRRDVRLAVDGNRIAAVHSGFLAGAPQPDYDFGMAVITPGLVNAHAHLELEFCSGRVPYEGSFIDWLQAVRDLKREQQNGATTFPQTTLGRLSAAGCTTVVDHHTVDLDWEAIEGAGLRYVPFREFFQFNNHDPSRERMKAQSRLGLAAHAPYTASLEVARACRALNDEARLPLSAHMSEFPAELQFIRDGHNAEIERLLSAAGATDPQFRGYGCSPVKLYADAGLLSGPTYAIHVNYLEEGDMELLAALRPTIVFCPRSHAFFRHPRHHIERYLAAGIPVALGTDSLASNALLSPLHEAALLREQYPQVSAEDVFAALTVRGLEPLGWQRHLGRLEPGYLADFAVFPLPADPGPGFAGLLDAMIAGGKSAFTVQGGKVIHSHAAVPVTST